MGIMKVKLTGMVLVALTLFFNYKAYATNYYVSNSGNDSANGTSPETAWKTIAKVNSGSYLPGDSILFKCGDIWRMETLIPPSSGTKQNYITFSSYGKGPKPKLYGSEVIKEYAGKASKTNVYNGNKAITYNPWNYNYHGAIFFKMNDSTVWGDSYAGSLSELDENFEWHWQNDTLYFYYDGNISDIDSIEVEQADRGINIGTEYIIIDGFEIKFWLSRCIGCPIYPERRVDGLIIRNNILAYTGIREGGVGYGVQLFHSNMLVEKNIAFSNGRRNLSFNIVNQTGSCTLRDIVVQDNELFDGWHTTGIDVALQGLNHTIRNIIVRRNKIWEDPKIDKSNYHVTMNFIENNGDVGDFDSLFFYSNIIMNASRPALQIAGISNAFVINNTFTGAPFDYTGTFAFIYHGFTGNSTIMNNIFFNYMPTSSYISVRGATGGTGTTLDTLNYNLYFAVNNDNYLLAEFLGTGFGLRQTQWTEIQALGYELNSLTPPQDPLFVNSLYDLRLQEGSPAIGTAKPVSFVNTDITGKLRSKVNPCIGAYEYNEEVANENIGLKSNIQAYSIYPNPFQNFLFVNQELEKAFKVQLFDLSGKMLFEELFLGMKINKITIPEISEGLYILRLTPDSGVTFGAYILKKNSNSDK
ncbi:MAG: T9SS type A sorting domain-containing protein [Bacteroidales bacterium]|nr:T9SS type A sorting domain-containing protein [Bacteroidales bacterium]